MPLLAVALVALAIASGWAMAPRLAERGGSNLPERPERYRAGEAIVVNAPGSGPAGTMPAGSGTWTMAGPIGRWMLPHGLRNR